MSSDRRSTAGIAAPASSKQLVKQFASTVHGLEAIASAELAARGHQVLEIRKRQVLIASPERLTDDRPRTVDDLLLRIAQLPDPGPTKAGLDLVRRRLRAVDLAPVPGEFLDRGAVFAVSASVVGRRTFNRYDLEEAVGSVLAERFGARFVSRRDGVRPPEHAVEWRAVLAPEGLLLGLRGRRAPLHRRPWKTASVPGSLHPPVAAAMARLARIGPGVTVLDPCCGAGTIPAEAHGLEPRAHFAGSDLDPDALAAAVHNARHLPGIAWTRADAAQLPFRDGSIDRIVTNPAWGRQVATRRPLARLLQEWRRMLAVDGRLVCLVPSEELHRFSAHQRWWSVVETHRLSLAGRHPVIVVAEPSRARSQGA